MKHLKLFAIVVGLLWVPFVASAAVTPEQVKALIDLAAVPIMWAVGALYSRLPALKKWPNAAIPWLNLGTYVLATYFVPPAQAGFFDSVGDFGSLVWNTARAGATSAVASLFYDKFFKSPFDKYVPKAR